METSSTPKSHRKSRKADAFSGGELKTQGGLRFGAAGRLLPRVLESTVVSFLTLADISEALLVSHGLRSEVVHYLQTLQRLRVDFSSHAFVDWASHADKLALAYCQRYCESLQMIEHALPRDFDMPAIENSRVGSPKKDHWPALGAGIDSWLTAVIQRNRNTLRAIPQLRWSLRLSLLLTQCPKLERLEIKDAGREAWWSAELCDRITVHNLPQLQHLWLDDGRVFHEDVVIQSAQVTRILQQPFALTSLWVDLADQLSLSLLTALNLVGLEQLGVFVHVPKPPEPSDTAFYVALTSSLGEVFDGLPALTDLAVDWWIKPKWGDRAKPPTPLNERVTWRLPHLRRLSLFSRFEYVYGAHADLPRIYAPMLEQLAADNIEPFAFGLVFDLALSCRQLSSMHFDASDQWTPLQDACPSELKQFLNALGRDHWPHLTQFFSSHETEDLLPSLRVPALRKFSLRGARRWDMSQLCSFLQSHPLLEHVNCGMGLEDEEEQELFSQLVQSDPPVTTSPVTRAVLPCLQSATFDACTDSVFERFLFTALRSLDIGNNAAEGTPGQLSAMDVVFAACPTLATLCLSGSRLRVGRWTLSHTNTSLTQLTMLNVAFPDEETEGFFGAFVSLQRLDCDAFKTASCASFRTLLSVFERGMLSGSMRTFEFTRGHDSPLSNAEVKRLLTALPRLQLLTLPDTQPGVSDFVDAWLAAQPRERARLLVSG